MKVQACQGRIIRLKEISRPSRNPNNIPVILRPTEEPNGLTVRP